MVKKMKSHIDSIFYINKIAQLFPVFIICSARFEQLYFSFIPNLFLRCL